MTSSGEDVNILTTCFCIIFISVVVKAPYALTTKSDLELFFPVTSSDEEITIFRGYYCKYQLAERPVRHGIICETSGKCASQTSKQKHMHAKHFG